MLQPTSWEREVWGPAPLTISGEVRYLSVLCELSRFQLVIFEILSVEL